MEIKNKADLFDKIQEAAAEYSAINGDRDFTVVVKITVSDGWTAVDEA